MAGEAQLRGVGVGLDSTVSLSPMVQAELMASSQMPPPELGAQYWPSTSPLSLVVPAIRVPSGRTE